MKKREEHYLEMQRSADEVLESATEAKDTYESKLRAADEEIAMKKKQAAEELEQLRRKKTKEAEEEASRILEDARSEGQAMRDQIVDSAKEQITDLMDEIARKALVNEDVSTTFDAFLDVAERGAADGKS